MLSSRTEASQGIHKIVVDTWSIRAHPKWPRSRGKSMSRKTSSRIVRVASAATICLTLALGTAGVALAGQRSHSHGQSSFGRRDQGQSSSVSGVVSALGTDSITLNDRHGDATTYTTSGTTTYFEGKTAVTATDLAKNEFVSLELTSTSPQTVTKVDIHLVRFVGPVTAVAGDTITISGRHGASLSVIVSSTAPATTYTSGGAASTLAAVVVGAVIDAVGLPGATAGTLDASKVNIRAPHVQTHLSGVVSALGTNSITLKDRHGNVTTYTTSGTTTYFEGKTTVSASDLAKNELVSLELTSTAPQTVTKVDIHPVRFVGPVTAVAGDTITIAGRHGASFSVVVSTSAPATTYTSGGAAATLAAVVVGAVIDAVGLPGATAGTLDASSVNIILTLPNHQGSGPGHAKGAPSSAHSQSRGPSFGRGRGRH
jgi:ribosomal protein S11